MMSHSADETSMVDESAVENFWCEVVALAEGTKKSAEPVSKMTSGVHLERQPFGVSGVCTDDAQVVCSPKV